MSEPGVECFNALCGFDAEHEHGPECTIECLCGLGTPEDERHQS